MNWTFKMRGEEVTYKILESETAVKLPTHVMNKITPDELAMFFGEMVGDEPFDGDNDLASPADRDVFIRAGWHFVRPHLDFALATEVLSKFAPGVPYRQVILSDTRALLIDTDLATVKLNGDLSAEQAEKLLVEDGLSIVYHLRFARNTFEVRLPPGRPMPEVIDALQAKTDRYLYAEPSLLQIINGRESPVTEPGIKNGKQWHHRFMGSPTAWDDARGAKVRVAVIDNGMQISHPELKGAIVSGGFFRGKANGEADFIRLTPGISGFPETINAGHGTFCLGLVGARLNGSYGCGIAPEAELIAMACLNDQVGTQATLARAIHLAVDPTDKGTIATTDPGADVISCSLNTQNLLNSNLREAITFAHKKGRGKKGVPIFWAVSNRPQSLDADRVFSHPDVIGVSQHDRDGTRFESAFGERLEYLAPGREIFSTGALGNFNRQDGTSFATALAAGVAALVLSIRPELTADQVRELLRKSCDPAEIKHHDKRGFGLLKASLAVKNAMTADL